jgi:hypothetical protein
MQGRQVLNLWAKPPAWVNFFMVKCTKYIKFIILTILNIQFSGIWCITMLWIHHLFSEPVHHPTQKLCTHSQFPTSLSLQLLVISIFFSVSMNLPILDTSCKQNHRIYFSICVRFISLSKIFNLHPCCIMNQNFIFPWGWKIFYYMFISHLLIHSLAHGYLGCFQPLTILKNVAMNDVQWFVWVSALILSGIK